MKPEKKTSTGKSRRQPVCREEFFTGMPQGRQKGRLA
jgi:hypothetical protein